MTLNPIFTVARADGDTFVDANNNTFKTFKPSGMKGSFLRQITPAPPTQSVNQPLFVYQMEDFTDELGGSDLISGGVMQTTSANIGDGQFFNTDVNAYLQIPESSATSFGDHDWFISLWFWIHTFAANTTRTVMSRHDFNISANRNFFLRLDPSEILTFQVHAGNIPAASVQSSALALETWYHMVAVVDKSGADEIRLYINSALQQQSSLTLPIQGITTFPVSIGRNVNPSVNIQPFVGTIDQTLKGDFVPSQTAITNLFASGSGVSDLTNFDWDVI